MAVAVVKVRRRGNVAIWTTRQGVFTAISFRVGASLDALSALVKFYVCLSIGAGELIGAQSNTTSRDAVIYLSAMLSVL